MEISRYFEPNFTGKYEKTFDEAAAEVEKVMKESVEKHKISDVEVASLFIKRSGFQLPDLSGTSRSYVYSRI